MFTIDICYEVSISDSSISACQVVLGRLKYYVITIPVATILLLACEQTVE